MLTFHTKIINQRKIREEELEHAITDLCAALVIAKKIRTIQKHNNDFYLQQRLK